MNFGPKNFDFESNCYYVIIELNQSIAFSDNSFKIIGITHSLEMANKYSGSNRIIRGPIPMLDSYFPEPKYEGPIPNFIPFIYQEVPKINPFEIDNPQFNFYNIQPTYPQFKNNFMDTSK